MGSRVRIRLFHLHFVIDLLFPLLKNSKSGVDDRGHRLRITHTPRRLRLKEYFYGKESSEYYNPQDDNPFKCKSTWTPDKNREPALELFIHLITKDILNTKPLKIADNLTKQEREALKILPNETT